MIQFSYVLVFVFGLFLGAFVAVFLVSLVVVAAERRRRITVIDDVDETGIGGTDE